MKTRLMLAAICLLASIWHHGHAGEAEIFSGPQVGETIAPFEMQDVSSDDEQTINLVEQAQGNPLLIIFMHERTRPAFGLMNVITRYAATREKDKLITGVCLLTDDPTSTKDWMKRGLTAFYQGHHLRNLGRRRRGSRIVRIEPQRHVDNRNHQE